jgi:hypothetical protein
MGMFSIDLNYYYWQACPKIPFEFESFILQKIEGCFGVLNIMINFAIKTGDKLCLGIQNE